jgi:hypothetical protein
MSTPRLVPCYFAGDGIGKQVDRRCQDGNPGAKKHRNLGNMSQPEEEVTNKATTNRNVLC